MTSALRPRSAKGADNDAKASAADGPAYVRHQSGFAPRRQPSTPAAVAPELDQTLELALAESARSEANLNLLLRGLRSLVAGATAMRDSHTALRQHLERTRQLLACSETAFDPSASGRSHEDAVERARADAARERNFLIEEQNAFLTELLDDHAREVGELKRALSALGSRSAEAPPAPNTQSGEWRLPFESSSEFSEVDWDELEEIESNPIAAGALAQHKAKTLPGLGVEATPSGRASRPPKLPHPAR